jgi:hypothetical protein
VAIEPELLRWKDGDSEVLKKYQIIHEEKE